ncbi:MAG: hypothetical protein JWQ71_1593 [Pedosphaera sp.]|nr:hypothetical protein [Pedosphaera sp.]
MFNLEQAIVAWRQQMSAGGIKTPEPLDELESHLREDIEEQLRSGITAQQAFASAVQRIGQASALKLEFEKIGQTKLLLRFAYLSITLLAVLIAAATVHLNDALQPLCLAEGLLLSLILPDMARTSAQSLKDSEDHKSLLRTVWIGQIFIALGGALIICSPLHPILGLVFAVISCVLFTRKLRRQMRATIHPARLVMGS